MTSRSLIAQHPKPHKRYTTLLFDRVKKAISYDMIAFYSIPGDLNVVSNFLKLKHSFFKSVIQKKSVLMKCHHFR